MRRWMCVALLCVALMCAMLLCATALAEEDPFGGAERLERNEVYELDLDGDGKIEILLSGDEASADFFTWCLKYDHEASLTKVPFADANRGDNTGEYGECGYGRIDAIDGLHKGEVFDTIPYSD